MIWITLYSTNQNISNWNLQTQNLQSLDTYSELNIFTKTFIILLIQRKKTIVWNKKKTSKNITDVYRIFLFTSLSGNGVSSTSNTKISLVSCKYGAEQTQNDAEFVARLVELTSKQASVFTYTCTGRGERREGVRRRDAAGRTRVPCSLLPYSYRKDTASQIVSVTTPVHSSTPALLFWTLFLNS